MASEPRLVEVRRNVLKKNDLAAAELRRNFRDAGVSVISLVDWLGQDRPPGKDTDRVAAAIPRGGAGGRPGDGQ